ncbi:MAG: phosphatidylserine decarboxylase family protein [Bacteroidetes bacterium]|nr:phosphatidylserine decarboxylase family protein [Bacteroidota bacterium]HET6243970.1 phosphatidylserine decarboxylase family protein [Bacteroidia bacterium]
MKFHKEGYPTLIAAILFIAVLIFISHYLLNDLTLFRYFIYVISAILLITVLQFFRNPKRNFTNDDAKVICPADGKVVVIEEVLENEYFQDKRIQVSVFMSPVNVHINRYPVSGVVKYVKYHPGKYLVAWHPKSSTENERSSIVLETKSGKELLIRQIAGALARRIVYYCKPEQQVKQGTELGFIKFGSRVDVFFPLNAKIEVTLNQKVKGGETILGTID